MDRHPNAPRCVTLDGSREVLAEQFAAATGLTVADASTVVDRHIVRGQE
jgi:hypothetical protein